MLLLSLQPSFVPFVALFLAHVHGVSPRTRGHRVKTRRFERSDTPMLFFNVLLRFKISFCESLTKRRCHHPQHSQMVKDCS